MERLRVSELRKVLEVVRELYAAHDLDGFVASTLAALLDLVPSDFAAYGELNVPRRRFRFVEYPDPGLTPALREAFRQHSHEHPFARHYRAGSDGSAATLSDLVTLRQFRETGIYQEFFRHIDIDREAIVWLPAPRPLEINFGLNRAKRDFTQRERGLLNLLRPHLIQAYRNAEAITLLRQAASHRSRALVLLTTEGQIGDLDALAGVLLAEYFGPIESGRGLPHDLARWVRQQERVLETTDDGPPPLEPLVVEREGKRLVVRLFAGPAQRLLLLTEHRTVSDPRALETLGLTPREAEVLRWVAEGKRNEEIAAILGLSPRTVTKHVENLMRKLGVETRTAAAARALAVLHDPSESGQGSLHDA